MPIWISIVEWLARIILVGLVGLSIWSVAVIIDRLRCLSNLQKENFVKKLTDIADAFPQEKVFEAISHELFQKKQVLEKGLGVLGTLGSTTPFIGLLGTILGIIVAFGELSMGTGDTNAIMFALAEALILTAVGLFVAIPAVIAFNIFKKQIRTFFEDVGSQMDSYLANRKNS